jgi:hypothetical protein
MDNRSIVPELAGGAAATALASQWLSAPFTSIALKGGLIAGSCDLIYAITAWSTQGVPAKMIPLSIASGVLGKAAFAGGLGTIVFGVSLHFMIAVVMAAAFAAAAAAFPALVCRPIRTGACYGLLLYGIMNYLVVPLSRAPISRPPIFMAMADLGAHLLLVGIPIALITARSLARP